MTNIEFENKKIYDDYQTLVNKQKRNWISRVYQIIAGIWIFIAGIVLLLLADKVILLSEKVNIAIFFNFTTERFKEVNFVLMLRIAILSFLFIYPISKIFADLFINKEKVEFYLPWFIWYLLSSITAFVLFMSFRSIDGKQVIYLLYAFIPLYVFDLTYAIFAYYIKRKSNPLTVGNVSSLIITQVARALLVSAILACFFIWTKSSIKEAQLFLHYNQFSDWFRSLFKVKKASNLAIVIALFIGASLLLFFSFWDKIILITSGNLKGEYLKNKLYFTLILLASIAFWILRVFFIKVKQSSYFDEKVHFSPNYLYLLFTIVPILALTLYLVINLVRIFKTKNTLTNSIIFGSLLSLIWISFMILSFNNNDNGINLIVLFITVLASISMMGLYLKNNATIYNFSLKILNLNILVSIIIMSILGFERLMQAQNNYAFSYLNSDLNLVQIFAVVQSTLTLTILVGAAIKLIFVLYKLHKTRKTKRGVENE